MATEVRDEVYEYFKEMPLDFMYAFTPPPKDLLCSLPFFHIELCHAAETHKYLAVAAPRGSAKSTVLAYLKPMHSILFKKKRFILLISNTFTKSILTLQSIKIAVQKNPRILKHFPGITFEKDSEGDTEFRHPDGFTTKVLCRGVDQLGATRGVKFGDYRPDLIIGDDMEDDELVRSPERRIQLQSDFDDALIPTGDRNTQYIFIGTILHDDSLLAKLVSKQHYPDYEKLIFKARYEENGVITSLWPQKWTVEQLNKIEKDRPSTFAKEYQNDPASGANTRIKREDFRYWGIDNMQYVLFDRDGSIMVRGQMHECKAAIGVDLAWSERKDADSSVLMPIYVTPHGDLLVDTYVAERGMRPDKFAEYLFTMESKLRMMTGSSVPVGMEKAMLEKVTQWVLKSEMRKRNHWLTIKELKWETDKITRIETVLQPRYSQNIVFHRQSMGDLEEQLVRFPSGVNDDIIDALQGAIRLLEFPKSPKKREEIDSDFDWWRTQAINAKYPKKKQGTSHFIFGNKLKRSASLSFYKGFIAKG